MTGESPLVDTRNACSNRGLADLLNVLRAV
jgi:hypothetical protein